MALDEQSQNVKEVIAEVIAVSAVNISDSVVDQLNNANIKSLEDVNTDAFLDKVHQKRVNDKIR